MVPRADSHCQPERMEKVRRKKINERRSRGIIQQVVTLSYLPPPQPPQPQPRIIVAAASRAAACDGRLPQHHGDCADDVPRNKEGGLVVEVMVVVRCVVVVLEVLVVVWLCAA